MEDNNGLLQDMLTFTVEIRTVDHKISVGTGIIVSTDGKIITCSHVVKNALGKHPREALGTEIGVYFNNANPGKPKELLAIVICCLPSPFDDDIVLLRLLGESVSFSWDEIAILGDSALSEGNPFLSFGYAPLADIPADKAEGVILGAVPPPRNSQVMTNPIRLKSGDIRPGFSGSAVLDTKRNLVIGLISERWNDDIHRPIEWAVDSRVLTFEPFLEHNISLRYNSLSRRPLPRLSIENPFVIRQLAIPDPGVMFYGAPSPLDGWIGRSDYLKTLDENYLGKERRVVGLVGFAGEGKSSLARRWIDRILSSADKPDGVFWWSFYYKPDTDVFLESVLVFLTRGRVVLQEYPSASLRAQIIATMLGARRYIFVLDGLEIMQNNTGDRYGLITSESLRDFLWHFANPEHTSFCLITSRAPMLDLIRFGTTYVHHEVNRLSDEEGQQLLITAGIHGDNEKLSAIVADWEGHALTLSLLAAYFKENHDGDANVYQHQMFPEITIWEKIQKFDQRVGRILARYDANLGELDKAFLKIFCIFRLPVKKDAFAAIFRRKFATISLNTPLVDLDDQEFYNLVTRLVERRMLNIEKTVNGIVFSMHPLVRNYYLASLREADPIVQATHVNIGIYYLVTAPPPSPPKFILRKTEFQKEDTPPTLDALEPYIEAVHHVCQAEAYDDAFSLQETFLEQGESHLLIFSMGAYETELMLLKEYFPSYATEREPLVSELPRKGYILNSAGICLMALGQLREAVSCYNRSATISSHTVSDLINNSQINLNLSAVYVHQGELDKSIVAASEALVKSREFEIKFNSDFGIFKDTNWQDWYTRMMRMHRGGLAYLAWALHLLSPPNDELYQILEKLGERLNDTSLKNASITHLFSLAVAIHVSLDLTVRHLFGNEGIFHAQHLLRIGEFDYARKIIDANLNDLLPKTKDRKQESQWHRILGDLEALKQNHDAAQNHYDIAIKITRAIQRKDTLIEALLARGRWYAKHGSDHLSAFNDLHEALSYAGYSGYRIYEADIHVGLAWAHLRKGERALSKHEAEQAVLMSKQLNYHWAQVDAQEILEMMSNTV